MDLKAVVPLHLVLRHVIALCQVDFSLNMRRLRGGSRRRLYVVNYAQRPRVLYNDTTCTVMSSYLLSCRVFVVS